jgi:hypothetical protein
MVRAWRAYGFCSYLKDSRIFVRYMSSIVTDGMPCLTTSPTRRSETDSPAVLIGLAAVSSAEVVVVPTMSISQ